MDRDSVNDISQISPELQAGFGYKVSERLDVSLMAQHVFGNNPNVLVNALNDTATITHIPSQQAVFLGLTLTLE